jgi:hypothetical protein
MDTAMTTTTKREIKPSGRALAAARKLARDAVKRDHWLSPYPEEDIRDADTLADLGDISERHRSSWEQTDHFHLLYGTRLSQLADAQECRFGQLEWEERYYGLYLPLKEVFWDEWEDKSGFWDKAEKAVNERDTT